jgi:biopolymer transport protein TolR
MASRRRARSPFNADINVTSLVDVAFVLLIIFMITAPMMQGGVQLQLPRAATRALAPQRGVVVSVDSSGRVYVDQAAFSYQDFRATFRGMVARRRPAAIYLRADRAVPYGDVVRVLAVIRAAGVRDVNLVAEPETTSR